MKKIFLLITILSFSANAQNEIGKKVNQLLSENTTFRHFSVLTESNEISNKETKSVVEKATFAKINSSIVNEIVQNKYENLELEIPYQSESILVQIYKVNLFADDFQIDTDKAKNVAYNSGVYYRGVVKGDSSSTVSFNFFENELNGIISSKILHNLVIGKLQKTRNIHDYIIYSDADLKISNNFQCATKDTGGSQIPEPMTTGSREAQSARCVTVYFELRYNVFQANGNNLTATNNWMTSVYNNIQTLYNGDGISSAIKSLFVWTSPDPYSGNTSVDYLFQFNDNRCVFNGDLGELIGFDGGLGGVAVGINGLCTTSNFSYSSVDFDFNTVPLYSWTINVIAHELGHLMGSPHTHDCAWNGNNTRIDGCGNNGLGDCPDEEFATDGGTIMSYCHIPFGQIDLNNGFGPQPKARILNKINNAPCLGTNCTTTCINTICTITPSNVTSSAATVTWADTNTGNTSWKLSVKPFADTPVYNNVTTQTFNVNSLLSNTYYKAKVGANCGATFTPSTSDALFLTSANYCSGITLTDTGGAAGDYQDDQTYVRTLIPNIANKRITLTFSEFSLEDNYDYFHVYDGNSELATEFNGPLGFTGTTIPGPFTSTAADGSLTIKFYSDGGVIDAGYVANVACLNSLGISDFNQIDFSYYPNPTNGIVKINSNTEITEIIVYSVTGQLLLVDKTKQLNSNVNIADFANGTYFFKVKFGEKETNFKIQKN
jgi:Metallo-peptidase family M12/Secretion system C-terminal sorting domain/CUB domain